MRILWSLLASAALAGCVRVPPSVPINDAAFEVNSVGRQLPCPPRPVVMTTSLNSEIRFPGAPGRFWPNCGPTMIGSHMVADDATTIGVLTLLNQPDPTSLDTADLGRMRYIPLGGRRGEAEPFIRPTTAIGELLRGPPGVARTFYGLDSSPTLGPVFSLTEIRAQLYRVTSGPAANGRVVVIRQTAYGSDNLGMEPGALGGTGNISHQIDSWFHADTGLPVATCVRNRGGRYGGRLRDWRITSPTAAPQAERRQDERTPRRPAPRPAVIPIWTPPSSICTRTDTGEDFVPPDLAPISGSP